ncbi:STM4015 family protein [Streptomyces sp. BE133]|uniref:STM4015 family protein n=1 Tax=Streptomyces sp. BE133 TaxID=3002523 RepID=UPI002E7A9963|nr:STM4015 family protein [Streptomyces sp. BE133]MEE1805937.1 STM4015 family protein [Streptomyces sp. BE133]
MTDIEHPETFLGLPVLTLPGPDQSRTDPLPAADSVAWRLESAWQGDLTFAALWQHFLDTVDTSRVRALLIGPWWQEEYESFARVVELLAGHADRFPALKALFLADVVSEECELSWLEMSDITPVIEAFGQLEELTVRGCGEPIDSKETLGLRPVRHKALKSLRFESGGLPSGIVRAIGASELPALEHLELWLGVTEYGGDATVEDLAPLLSGAAFPALRHLGLQNSEIQDEIAAAVASAPVVAQLESLSLAMGTLGDEGAESLLSGQPLTHLTSLDLHHHYISDALVDRLRNLLGSDRVNGEIHEVEYWDPEGDDDRYVAVAE